MTIFHNKLPLADLSDLPGLHFLPSGGCGEIGMNANFYCCDNDWLMLDNGVTFNRYPEAVLMADIRAFVEAVDVKTRLKGMVITHAHEDHVGAVAYLLPYLRCPVYATPFTAHILRHKLKESGIRGDCVIEVPLEQQVSIGPFGIEFVSLTHSIPEPSAVVIRTPHGTVFHTGDWKIDPTPLIGPAIDHNRMKKLGDEGILALVCDSTNVFEEGSSGSEHAVKVMLERLVSKCSGKVVLSCFSSNLARVKSAYDAAVAAGRKVCVVGRSLQRMVEAAYHCGYFDHSVHFIPMQEVNDYPPTKVLIMTTGSQAEPMAALTRMSHKKHPVLTIEEGDTVIFSSRVIPGNQEAISALQNRLIRMGVNLIIREKDVENLIGTEKEWSQAASMESASHPEHSGGHSRHPNDPHKTRQEDVDVIEAFQWGNLHVSGHPCRDELAQMYKWLRPLIVIPVHGEDLHIKEQAALALSLGVPYTIRPGNGQLFRLTPEGAFCEGYVPSGRLAMDGRRLVEADGPVIRQRQMLAEKGILEVVLLVSRYQNRVREKILSHGVFEHEQERKEWTHIIRGLVSAEFAQNSGPVYSSDKGGNKEEDAIMASDLGESIEDANSQEEEKFEQKRAVGRNSRKGKGVREEDMPLRDSILIRDMPPKALANKCFALQRSIQESFRNKWAKSPLIKVSFITT